MMETSKDWREEMARPSLKSNKCRLKTFIEAFLLQIDKAHQARNNDIGIWKDGCIEILEVMLKRDFIEYPFAWVYIGVGLILALVELITVVLSCAYIAQINRSGSKV